MAAYYPLFDEELEQGPPGIPGIGFKLTHDGNYDMENNILKNCRSPEDDSDAATKTFVLTETNAILESRCLTRKDKKPFDAKGERICNIGDPTEDRNAVNKKYLEKYVDNKVCYATTALGYITFRPSTNANAVIFTKFSGDALNSECKFSRDGFFRLGLYLDPQKIIDELIVVKLHINNMRYAYQMKVATEFSWFGEVKQDDQLKIFLRCDAEFTVQPLLKVEEIKWTLQLP